MSDDRSGPADARWQYLEDAIENDEPDAVRRLLAEGAPLRYNVERHSRRGWAEQGWTPLHHAIDVEGDARNQRGIPCDMRLIAPVLEAGADVNAVWIRGSSSGPRTPLDMALDYEHDRAIAELSRRGATRGSA